METCATTSLIKRQWYRVLRQVVSDLVKDGFGAMMLRSVGNIYCADLHERAATMTCQKLADSTAKAWIIEVEPAGIKIATVGNHKEACTWMNSGALYLLKHSNLVGRMNSWFSGRRCPFRWPI